MCVIVSVRSGCMACFRSCACKLSGGATAKRQRYPRGTGDSEHKGPFTIQQYALDAVRIYNTKHCSPQLDFRGSR